MTVAPHRYEATHVATVAAEGIENARRLRCVAAGMRRGELIHPVDSSCISAAVCAIKGLAPILGDMRHLCSLQGKAIRDDLMGSV